MAFIGFSTGALALEKFDLALAELRTKPIDCVELSALRIMELRPLLESIPRLSLSRYQYVSLHAPSRFASDEERETIELLLHLTPPTWPIILHPDTISTFARWRVFGKRIAIENMDRRKPIGRTADELSKIFEELPEARFCFDIGHARQLDTTMTEAYKILQLFGDRLCQVHISEVNSSSQHERLSFSAILAFEQVSRLIPANIPLIIESRVTEEEIDPEIESVRRAIPRYTSAFLPV
jgi:Xylose isomerase-like TIM barrel